MAQYRCIPLRASHVLAVAAIVLVLQSLPSFSQAGTIQRTYNWRYNGAEWSFTYDFPSAAYQRQKALPRTLNYTAYAVYINDPRETSLLHDFVAKFEASVPELAIWQRLNLLIAMIQSIPYVPEPCEYPRYPIEMLVEQQGDCEDAAILAASLVSQMGFGVVLLAFLEEHHMALGVRVLPPQYQDLQSYEFNGDAYFYLEPTSPGWAIGQVPKTYQSVPEIIPLEAVYANR